MEIIERNGKQFAIMPLEEYELLAQGKPSVADSDNIGSFPQEVTNRIGAGENRIRVLRQWRGMTQKVLADAAGIARPYLTEIETGKKQGAVASLKSIAKALGVELKDVA